MVVKDFATLACEAVVLPLGSAVVAVLLPIWIADLSFAPARLTTDDRTLVPQRLV
jgi:hypothetical protein